MVQITAFQPSLWNKTGGLGENIWVVMDRTNGDGHRSLCGLLVMLYTSREGTISLPRRADNDQPRRVPHLEQPVEGLQERERRGGEIL